MSNDLPSLTSTLPFIQQQLTRYVYSAFLIFGITGSCLNILLLSRRQFRTSSCCICEYTDRLPGMLIALPLSLDLWAMSIAILILLSWVIGLYLYALDHPDPVTTTVVFCKMRIYVLQASALTYRWYLTVACIDRFAASAVNARLRNLATLSIARRAAVVIPLAWIVLPMHSLILYNLRGNICGILYSSAGALYHSIFTTVVAGVLPPAIMVTCAVLIYRNLVQKRQRRQIITAQESSRTDETKHLLTRRDQQVLLMLLIQATAYVITTLPLMAVYFYNALTIFLTNKPADRVAIERFSQYLAEMICFLFPAASFYLYTMASRTFRKELVCMVSSAVHYTWSKDISRVKPITTDAPVRSTDA